MVVGELSKLLIDEERSRRNSRSMRTAAAKSSEGPAENKKRAKMMSRSQEFSGSKTFKIPLHYPRYTKKQYEHMAEWKLDLLLQDYGLPIDHGDLAYKRELAISTFIWPEYHSEDFAVSSVDSDCNFNTHVSELKRISNIM
ncbi:hypothetical protein MANES_10G025700v8 [Manihot esculenta]|uniref:Uncharacterized protein n=1 Tax=Manihot esculenta TaxID=3983 RepID=A0ACB7GXT0_MANES|nr:hypothetical protein MANES_10G025700v8 [Manihot esculenta]